MSGLIELRRKGRLLHVALNRPEKRNALNIELCRKLFAALEEAAGDKSVGAVLLTGRGKGFCAGMDLAEVMSAEASEINSVQERLFTAGARLDVPIVGAVHGPALGGGTGLAANCHIVVAADDAQFGLTEIRLGLWPFLIFRAVETAIGERRTAELALSGRTFGAEEARGMGLVHHVVPAAELERCATETALAVARMSPTAVRAGLEFVRAIRGREDAAAVAAARQARNHIFTTADFAEGVRAFREKRTPQWPSLESSQRK